jgi:hypothetical protein
MVSNNPVTLPYERGRSGEFGGKIVPETLVAPPGLRSPVGALGGYRGGV